MVKILKKYSFLFLLCLLTSQVSALADVPLITVKKQVVKSYSSLKNERLIIDNQYGDVVVKTWPRQKILVVVTLSVHATTTAAANKLLGRVNIAANRDENQIAVVSIIKKEQTKILPASIKLQKQPLVADTSAAGKLIKLLPKEGCNISYEVYLPANVSLSVSNQFGNITVGDYQGIINLNNKFGNITSGALANLFKLDIEQGDVDLKHISSGVLRAKGFGSIKIEDVGGKVTGTFSSGNLLNIGLTNRTDSVAIDADNIRQMNISGTATTNAGYNIKTILSQFFNKSTLQLRELAGSERTAQSKLGVDSLTRLLKKNMVAQGGTEKEVVSNKKKFEVAMISQLKKLREYEGVNGNAKGKIRIKIAFSILNILD